MRGLQPKKTVSGKLFRAVAAAAVSGILVFGFCAPAQAGLARGLLRVVGGLVELPRSIVAGTSQGPFIVGTLGGLVSGAIRSVGMIAAGTVETGLSAAGMALKYAPLIPIFL